MTIYKTGREMSCATEKRGGKYLALITLCGRNVLWQENCPTEAAAKKAIDDELKQLRKEGWKF